MEQNEEKVSLENNIKCLYSNFGCQEIVNKNNLEEYLKTNFDNHNKLLISYITKYKYDNRLNTLKKVKLEIEEKLEIKNKIYDKIDKNKKGTKLIQLNDYDNRSISLNESSSYRESEDEEYEKTYTKKTKNRYAVNVYGDKIGYYIESNDKVYTNSYFLNEHKNSKNNLQKQKEIENKKKEILDKLSKTIPYPFNDN